MPRLRYAMFALLAGCATEPKTDTLDPSVGDPSHPGEELPDPPDPTPEGPSPDGDLRVSVNVFNNRCDSPTLAFDVTAWEQDLNTRVPNIECVIEVNDGTKYLGCEGEHTFGGDGGGIGRITATVIDLDSGRTATETASAFVFPAFVPEMQITKPECGLSFTVQGNTSTSAFIALTVSPAENVVGDARLLGGGAHTVQVTQAGTYTIEMYAEDERGNGPICQAALTRMVTVEECHEHEPTCPHAMAGAASY